MGRWPGQKSHRPSENTRRLKIRIFNGQRDLRLNREAIRALVRAVLSQENSEPDEVALHFVSEEKIQEVHEKFFDDPSPTDCISFPLDGSLLGEIFVCPKAAIDYAGKDGAYEEMASLHHSRPSPLPRIRRHKAPREKNHAQQKEKSCMAYVKTLAIVLGPA